VLQLEGRVLFDAAFDGKLDKVRTAVDAGAPMEWADEDDWRSVHAASKQGHTDVVAFLGSRGADVNAVDGKQRTPLHFAALRGHTSVCTTLLALGADPAAKNEDGETALDCAMEWEELHDVVAVLEAWAAGERDPEALAKAAEEAKAEAETEEYDDY
jgi:ankyrin repeat protein